MGFFSKKEKEENRKEAIPSPSLPDLPTLPSIPNFEEQTEELPQLPNFPKTALGEKFSQDVIKKAVNGKKEEQERFLKMTFLKKKGK